MTPATLQFLVIDDGGGLNNKTPTPQTGRGLRNMDQRATRIGGTLQAIASECGTRIVLSLPWDVLSADAANKHNNNTGNRSV